jgi:hypothetical protein
VGFKLSIILAAALASSAFAQEPTPTPAAMDMGGSVMGEGPHLTMRGFSNVDLGIHEEGKPTTFALGQFDLLITSPLSDDITLLAETAVEFEEDEQGLDVERVQIKWAPSALFSVSAGRMHTPLGYWNQTFHHGTWFQTTERRPEMYLFEDDGGILPIHGVGIELAGTWHTSGLDFKYNASVLNGRGPDPEHVVHVQDASNNKAFSLWLAVAPASGLEIGGSGYFDRIPPDGVARTDTLREQIFTAYGAYVHSGIELIVEGSHMDHDPPDGAKLGTTAFYGQASWKHGRCRPYYRFDLVDVADGDTYLPAKDLRIHTAGLRVDASAWVALKAEYHLLRRHEEDTHAARLQAAFTF